MPRVNRGIWKVGRAVCLAAFVLATGGSAAYLAIPTPTAGPPLSASAGQPADKIRRAGRDAVLVPEALARNMGLRTVNAAARTRPIPLPPFQGCLALDSDRLARVHSRFAGEVVALGTTAADPRGGLSLRVGDRVRKGDLLAVVWSKDLGEKKSELADAVSKLRADEITFSRLAAAFRDASVPERSLRDAERAVDSDRIAVERAERTLRAWRLTDEEIQAVKAEASASGNKPDAAAWARVEVRAPLDGTVLEKNVTAGDIVDTAVDLYKVGDLSHLVAWVHVYEDDLPLLQHLPKPIAWSVQLPSRPGVTFAGRLEQVGAVIDPNQHTALVTGRVENPDGDLKVGQFVTISVTVPPPAGELELPADAVVEDGRESVVFVRTPGTDDRFVRTPVRVTCRFRESLCVRAGNGPAAGDQIVTAGSLLLRDAMDQLPVPPAR